MSGASVQVLKPKSQADRKLARLEEIKVWNYVSQSVADDIEAIGSLVRMAEEAYAMSNLPGMTDAFRLRAMQVSADMLGKAHTIRKETIHDRTIPVLKSVEVIEAMRALPGEEDSQAKQGDELAAFRKQLGEDLRQLCHRRALGIVEPELPPETMGMQDA